MRGKKKKSWKNPSHSHIPNIPSEPPEEVLEALRILGYESFRPGQAEAIMRILSGWNFSLLFFPAFLTEPNFPKFLIFFFGMFSQDYPRSWCYPQGWINPCATNFPLFSTTNIPAAFASSFPRSSPSWRIRYSRNSRFSYLTFCWIISKKNLEYSQSQLCGLPRCLKAVCIHSNLSRSQQEAAMEKVRKNSPNSRFFFF